MTTNNCQVVPVAGTIVQTIQTALKKIQGGRIAKLNTQLEALKSTFSTMAGGKDYITVLSDILKSGKDVDTYLKEKGYETTEEIRIVSLRDAANGYRQEIFSDRNSRSNKYDAEIAVGMLAANFPIEYAKFMKAVLHLEGAGRRNWEHVHTINSSGHIGIGQISTPNVRSPQYNPEGYTITQVQFIIEYNVMIACNIMRQCLVSAAFDKRDAARFYNQGPAGARTGAGGKTEQEKKNIIIKSKKYANWVQQYNWLPLYGPPNIWEYYPPEELI
jgi:hypothetical protein